MHELSMWVSTPSLGAVKVSLLAQGQFAAWFVVHPFHVTSIMDLVRGLIQSSPRC